MSKPARTITTERLLLRAPRPADAIAIQEYATDPDVVRYMDWPAPVSLADVAARIAGAPSRWESGEEYSWTITVKPGASEASIGRPAGSDPRSSA